MSDPEIIHRLLPELSQIKERNLAGRVVSIWLRAQRESGVGNRLEEFPFNYKTPNELLMNHVRKVTRFALALATLVAEGEGAPKIDNDILLASCLLHDLDKLFMYEPLKNGSGWQPSSTSRRFFHGIIGAMLCHEEGLPEVIVHMVATHALNSPLPPEPYEGVILHYADFFAADTVNWQHGIPLLLSQ